MESRPRLFVVDVMPLLYRGYFVFLRNPRITSTGINTSALHGFAASLIPILEEQKPTHVALVLDSEGPTFRHREYPPYKAQRQKAPEDLKAAIPMAIELGDALRLPLLRVEGYEADDLMGSLAHRARGAGWEVYLVTPDKDVAQLVGEGITLVRPGKSGEALEILGPAEISARWGLKDPRLMVDFLGLAGDASDNIPGIPGIGEKTALALLEKYGSLDAILAHADEIPGRLGERLREGRASAHLSRRLATIRADVPIPVALESLRRKDPDREALQAVLNKYELQQIGRRLLGESFEVKPAARRQSLQTTPHEYRLADTEEERNRLLEALRTAPIWSFDTETTGLDPWKARLVGLSFAVAPGRAWYLPVPPDEAAAKRWLEPFHPLFSDPDRPRVGHNIKFDLTVLRRYGLRAGGRTCDTMLAHYVLDTSDRHSLDHLARTYLDYEPIPIRSLIGERGAEQGNMGDLDPRQILDYAAEDADVTLRLHDILRREVLQKGARPALEECDEPLVEVLIEMEEAGIRVDPEVLRAYGRELNRELLELEQTIAKAAGCVFNVNSPKQLGEVLFERLKLDPRAAHTATGQYATGEEVLQKLADRHPVVPLILEHRACSKLKSTYVDKLPECLDPATGRIHTRFSQTLTETGRLSSSDPNLQNIPVRTERGQRIRQAFVPRDDRHVLLSADYSQIELRVMAALSGDAAMREAFSRGADIHAETAARVYGVMPSLVTPEMRNRCKMVNFGIIYGISAYGLSQRLGIPRQQAQSLIDAYFAQYPGVKAYMEKTISDARRRGYVQTVLGRRRYLRDLQSRNTTVRQAAERNAINTPIQGTAADLIKLAMIRIHRHFRGQGWEARMVLQIHDELLFDVPVDEVEAVREAVRQNMMEAMDLGVPLAVEIGVGRNWLEAH